MKRMACWMVCVVVWLATTACKHYCPDGYYKQDDTCYRVKDAGADGGDPDELGYKPALGTPVHGGETDT